MKDLLAKSGAGATRYKIGKSAKGTIVDVDSERVLVDLAGGLTGIIPKKESVGYDSEETDFAEGMEIEATVIDDEGAGGLVILSLRRASQDMVWAELSDFREAERTIRVKIEEANKGGLMARYKGLKAFLPVSQLMPMNYPRVDGASGSAILAKLQEHVGKDFVVRVINVDRANGKVILSEKQAHEEQARKTLESLQVGDVISGEVSGVVKFGIFVSYAGTEGLVHLSEMDWGLVSDPSKQYKIGDRVEVMVIGIDGEKLSFSIKRLSEDPWIEKGNKFSSGQEVSGKIVRWNQQGVFIEVEKDVLGAFELSDFEVEDPSELDLKAGDELSGVVREVNFDSHRLELNRV